LSAEQKVHTDQDGNIILCPKERQGDEDKKHFFISSLDNEGKTRLPSSSSLLVNDPKNSEFHLPEWLSTDQTHLPDFPGSLKKPISDNNSLISVENPSVHLPIHSLYDDRSSILYDMRRTTYSSPNRPIVLVENKEHYLAWLNPPLYLAFNKIEHLNSGEEKISKVAFLASKRGNSVYQHRIRTKVEKLEPYLKPNFIPLNANFATTNMLFITLTFNPNLFTIGTAWEDILQSSYNRYISALRYRYGKIAAVRCNASQKDGYPHLHLIVIFDHQIAIKKHIAVLPSGKTATTWRLLSLSKKEHDFAELWRLPIADKKNEYIPLGYVDVQGFADQKTVINYAFRYSLCKQGKNAADDLSLSLCWLYRKRSFSVSSPDLIKACITQSRILVKLDENSPDPNEIPYLTEYIFLGCLVIQYSDRSPPDLLDFSFNPDLEKRVDDTLSLL
jgi:hypothetical protein